MPKKGYTTITIRTESYEEITRIAHSVGYSSVEIIDYLLRLFKEYGQGHLITQPMLKALGVLPEHEYTWKHAFPAESSLEPYQAILMEPDVKDYKSTAWIRSKEYVDNVGYPQFRPASRAFLGLLKIQKMFILSKEALNNKKVSAWIQQWIVLQNMIESVQSGMLQIFVVDQENIPKGKINEKYFDMGIYGDIVVGYLELDEMSKPLAYTWTSKKEELETAENAFKELKELHAKRKEYEKLGLSISSLNL